MSERRLGLGLALAIGLAGTAWSQTATFAGAVVRDTLSHGLSGALVALPELQRSDTTDAQGEFKMTGLPAGRYAAVVRRIGFNPLVDTILLVGGTSVEREYVLDAIAIELDSVRVNAKKDVFVSPRLAQFEEHQKYATGGHFLTDSVLRRNEDRKLQDVLTSYIPGIQLYLPYPKTRPTVEYISSGRGSNCKGMACGGGCPVTLWIDGVRYFSAMDGTDVPDMTGFQIQEYAGVEYYAGGASAPLQYNVTGSGCGILVLWHRERM